MNSNLVYVGKIIQVASIEGADRIHLATAVCGSGGIWRGIVSKDLDVGSPVVVFQPDSLLPQDNPDYSFMEARKYRVKQRRFKGVPSECLILLYKGQEPIGTDVTEAFRVTKYTKQSPMHLNAEALGLFPEFIPKTDEMNIQSVPEMLVALQGKPFYITLKMDGMSSTAYKYNGHFGVCSRNLEIKDGDNPLWKVAKDNNLPDVVSEGFAIQWETCGPRIQGNPIGLTKSQGYAFNVWDIQNKKYQGFDIKWLKWMPFVPLIETGECFSYSLDDLQKIAEKLYPNGAPAEGIVVRPMTEEIIFAGREYQRLSFKVMNLNYKD